MSEAQQRTSRDSDTGSSGNGSRKALILDYGNVLAIGRSPTTVFKRQFDRSEQSRVHAIWGQQIRPEWRKLVRGQIRSVDFWKYVGKVYGVPVDIQKLEESCVTGIRINDSLMKMILAAKQKGHAIAMLTNNVKEWFERMNGIADFSMFDIIVTSYETGMRKPENGIYAYTLDRLGMGAEDCFFVDDGAMNVQAAQQLGIEGYVFDSWRLEHSNRELEERLREFGIL